MATEIASPRPARIVFPPGKVRFAPTRVSRRCSRSLDLFEVCVVRFRSWFLILLPETEDSLYNELWHACAGPLVSVPRMGERVFYFPQGHIEQVSSILFPGLRLCFVLLLLVGH